MALVRLRPVFSSSSTYLPMVFIKDQDVSTKINTTSYRSIPNPISNCLYLSFEQITNQPVDKLLSWLITPNTGMEVIQFLTQQLNFVIKYSIIGKIVDVKLLLPKRTHAYEPCDTNGCPIKFKQCGEFIIPGHYGQFIIRSTTPISMTLSVTGKFPKLDYFAISGPHTIFNVKSCDKSRGSNCIKSVPAYKNISVTNGMIQRVVTPELESLQDEIFRQFHSKGYLPCISNTLSTNTTDTVTVTTASQHDYTNNYVQPSIYSFCDSYTDPRVISIAPLNGFISQVSNSKSQFLIQGGLTCVLNVKATLTTFTFSQTSDGMVPGYAYIDGPNYFCDQGSLLFLFYSVNDKAPVTFDRSVSNPSPYVTGDQIAIPMLSTTKCLNGADTCEGQDMYVEATVLGDYTYVFNTPGSINDWVSYATRVNSPVWNWDYQSVGGTLYTSQENGPSTLNIKMTIVSL